MKKLLLFITVALLSVSMSSCLDMGSQKYNETSIVYISQHQGRMYGKTLSGRIITSEKMQIMPPRSFKIFHFSWDESYGYTQIGEAQADNVIIAGEPIDLPSTVVMDITAPEEAPEYRFSGILSPAHDPYGKFFDDFWLFEYKHEALEGERFNLEFYTRDYSAGENTVSIEIRLNRIAPAEENAVKKEYVNIVAADLGSLRSRYLGPSNEELKIKFYYHIDGNDEPMVIKTPDYKDYYEMINTSDELKPNPNSY